MTADDVLAGRAEYAIVRGDALASLRGLPDGCVQMVVTSPPYLNLRSYLPDDDPNKMHEIGLHASVDEFIGTLVEIFREVKRVLRDDGTIWVNLGSSYAGSGKGPTGHNGIGDQSERQGFDSGKKVGKVGRIGIVNGDEPYALRDNLTPDEMAYVFAELATSLRERAEMALPDFTIRVDPGVARLASGGEV